MVNLLYWFLVIIVFLLAGIKTTKPIKYQKVSVIIPAFNEEETVANVVEVVKKVSFVDEIVVVNDGSTDNTEAEAIKAGAFVINHNVNKGKGQALYTGYLNSDCDIIAFIDADIHNLTSRKVEAIIKPILDGKTDITKTKFARESGRVTELTAKPLLNFFFPEISFEQPLSGQFAAKKEVLRRINFEKDYGVDVGIVIDADVLGISIMEVDIGAIEHDMSPLSDLNLMANEVVRTIISRANKYGRVMMIDDMGYYIRMAILGLLFIILGLFTIFFVNIVPLGIGVLISVIGIIIAVFYCIKVIISSIKMYKRTPKTNLLKSFVKIHFPMIISVIILLLMITTFIGASHFENGVLSIEPNSRNLVIYADDTPTDNSISVRGPYTIDSAIENESYQIRMPVEAMMTLCVKENDTMVIGGTTYLINSTRDGESDIMRVPREAQKILNIRPDDVIQNSRLRDIFDGSLTTHSYENGNTTIKEEFNIISREKDATSFEVFLDNESVASSTGVFSKDSTYQISVGGEVVDSFEYQGKNNLNNVSFDYNGHVVEIVFKDTNATSFKQYIRSNEGIFLDLPFEK